MTVEFTRETHKVINRDGWSLWMPQRAIASLVNLTDPDIYAESSTQLYPLGTKLEFADGRVFRYCKHGATVTWGAGNAPTGRLVANGNLVPGSDDVAGYEGSLDATSDVAVGSTTLVLNDPEDRIENYYEDGTLCTFPSGHYVCYRIAGSEAATSVDDVTIYLSDPNGLQTLHVVNSTGVTAYASMFSNVMNPGDCTHGSTYSPCVGMSLTDAFTASYFGWVQRRGQCWITPTAYYGDGASERECQMHVYGESALKTSDTSQIIGYLTQMTISGYGDGMVWLNLE